ncbi:TPA: hypothetical protein ACGZ96_003589 [Elizabethkingia anophelis]
MLTTIAERNKNVNGSAAISNSMLLLAASFLSSIIVESCIPDITNRSDLKNIFHSK